MGAHTCSYVFKAENKAKAIDYAQDYQRQQQHESGHGAYTGHLGTSGVGVQVLEQTFDSAEAASEWIFDNHNKWDLPMLARCGSDGRWILAGWCSS